MALIELQLTLPQHQWPGLERALDDLGALAVTLLDAADEPILEPAAGATPLWQTLTVRALFDAAVDQRGLRAALAEQCAGVDPEGLRFAAVADADWTRAWMDGYQPMRFGERLWVVPSGLEAPAAARSADAVVLELDPGLAFGSGTHATTALCLRWLDALAAAGQLQHRVVLDYGAGSGILAIAALKLGAAHALAVDHDPQALTATCDNAQRNGIAPARIEVLTPAAFDRHPVAYRGSEVVLANILAGALIALEPTLRKAAAPGAPIALSGVLVDQADDVAAAWRGALAAPASITADGDWVRIDGVRAG